MTISRNKNGSLRQKKVPKRWNKHRLKARRLTEQFKKTYLSTKGVKSIGKSASASTYAGKRGFEIRVRINSEQFTADLPAEVEGIPVNIVKEDPSEYREGLGSCNCNGNCGDFSTITGGIATGEGSGNGWGTTYMKMLNSNNEARILSAAHVWFACSEYVLNKSARQADDVYGDVADVDENADWISINPDASADTTSLSKIREPDGTTRQVVGYLTPTGVDEYVVTNYDVYHFGAVTSRESGPVDDNQISNGFDCVDFDGKGIKCLIRNVEGNSGGPVYEITSAGEAEAICMYQKWYKTNLASVCCNPAGPYGDDECDLEDSDKLAGVAHHHLSNSYGFDLAVGI